MNLNFIKQRLKANKGKPIFNYLLGIYGHSPHLLNEKKRPKFIEVEGAEGTLLYRSVNQFYYRSKAISSFINNLIKIDRSSLIIVVSDHLPHLERGINTYSKYCYINCYKKSYNYNRIYVVQDGRPYKYTSIYHYDIPYIILD